MPDRDLAIRLLDTSDIARGQNRGASITDIVKLAPAQPIGHVGLQDVVDPRRPAAQMRLQRLPHLEPGLTKQADRQIVDFLSCCREQAE